MSCACSGRSPFGRACDQTGNVYVVDTGNCRVQKFDNAGNFVHLWGMFGTAPSNFHNPTGVTLSLERRHRLLAEEIRRGVGCGNAAFDPR